MNRSDQQTTSPDPSQERSRIAREKIIEAGMKLFEERGYEKTTSKDIAAAAGVGIGSFYFYFPDKRHLLLFIMERIAEEIYKDIFESLKSEQILHPQLRSTIRQAIADSIKGEKMYKGLHRAIAELMLKDAEFARRQRISSQRLKSKLYQLICELQQFGLSEEIDAEASAFVIHRAVFDLSQDYLMGFCDFDQDRAIDALSDIIYFAIFKRVG